MAPPRPGPGPPSARGKAVPAYQGAYEAAQERVRQRASAARPSPRAPASRGPDLGAHSSAMNSLLDELRQPQKLRCLSGVTADLREDRRRHFLHAAAAQLGVDKLKAAHEDTSFGGALSTGEGFRTIIRDPQSPMSVMSGGWLPQSPRITPGTTMEHWTRGSSGGGDCVALEVLENLVREAAHGVDTPGLGSSRASTAAATAGGLDRRRSAENLGD